MPSMRVQVQDTSADTDALGSTDLERAPGAGLVQVWVASTVNTATVTGVIGEANKVRNQVVPLKTNGIPNVNEDAPVMEELVAGGEKIVVNLGGTTGTIHTVCLFTPEDELP